jgi:hypothetical protein
LVAKLAGLPQYLEFSFYALLMLLFDGVFLFIAYNYTYVEDRKKDEDTKQDSV